MARRILYIFVAMIALQLSWNAITAYCMHETGRAAMHFGHHQHESTADELKVAAKDVRGTSKKLPQHDLHCGSCAHIALAAPDLIDAPVSIESEKDIAPETMLVPVSAFLTPPERPQWTGRT